MHLGGSRTSNQVNAGGKLETTGGFNRKQTAVPTSEPDGSSARENVTDY